MSHYALTLPWCCFHTTNLLKDGPEVSICSSDMPEGRKIHPLCFAQLSLALFWLFQDRIIIIQRPKSSVLNQDSSETGEQVCHRWPCTHSLSHLCFWIHLCLFSLSLHVCFFLFGRFGVKVSISLVLSPTPPDDPGVVREAYLFPLFSKSNPASSRKCFRRGPACHIPSASVGNTASDCIRAATSCPTGHRLITNKCFPQKDDAWRQKAPERRQIWFLLWEQHSG